MSLKFSDDLVLHTTAPVVPEFGNVKFLLSTKSMPELQTSIDIASMKITMKKKSFIFKITYFLKLKANESKTIQIKSILPKALRNSDFIARTCKGFLSYFPNSFMCKFSKGMELYNGIKSNR